MFASQKKLCTICNKKMVLGGKKGNSAHVDHDHKTGIVRGLICNNCNRLLGACFDDVWILHGAIRYLSGLPIKSTVVKWP